jgi:hypothetical protein
MKFIQKHDLENHLNATSIESANELAAEDFFGSQSKDFQRQNVSFSTH